MCVYGGYQDIKDITVSRDWSALNYAYNKPTTQHERHLEASIYCVYLQLDVHSVFVIHASSINIYGHQAGMLVWYKE